MGALKKDSLGCRHDLAKEAPPSLRPHSLVHQPHSARLCRQDMKTPGDASIGLGPERPWALAQAAESSGTARVTPREEIPRCRPGRGPREQTLVPLKVEKVSVASKESCFASRLGQHNRLPWERPAQIPPFHLPSLPTQGWFRPVPASVSPRLPFLRGDPGPGIPTPRLPPCLTPQSQPRSSCATASASACLGPPSPWPLGFARTPSTEKGASFFCQGRHLPMRRCPRNRVWALQAAGQAGAMSK